MFDNKQDLDFKIGKYKTKFGSEISLLYLAGHGNQNSFSDFNMNNSTKLNNISCNTQILLDACLTAGGYIKQSIAYKIAYENNCEVFGATQSIDRIQPIIQKDKNDNPRVISLGASLNGEVVPSYRITPPYKKITSYNFQKKILESRRNVHGISI